MDLVKTMIVKLIQESEELKESEWLRKLDIETSDVEEVFTKLIKSE